MELDGVGEEEGGDVAGVGAGDGDDAGLGQLFEDPHRLRRRRLPERMRRRRQRAVGVHGRVPAKAAAAAMAYEMLRRHADDLPTESPVSRRGFASESDHMKEKSGRGIRTGYSRELGPACPRSETGISFGLFGCSSID